MAKIIQSEIDLSVSVTSFDVGPDDRLRLSAVLRYQQEAAERQLTVGGLGWQGLAEKGMAFVASRWHTHITRLPEMGERVTLTTWHRERRGPRFFRCYDWRDAEGRVLLQGVMQFALVAVADHRLLRGEEFDVFGLPDQPARGVDCADPSRWKEPAMEAAGEFLVRWSDTDRNGHMNNTRYADLLCDALPGGMDGRRLTDVELYFAGETLPGETLMLSTGMDAEGGLYVAGVHERGAAFSAKVTVMEKRGVAEAW